MRGAAARLALACLLAGSQGAEDDLVGQCRASDKSCHADTAAWDPKTISVVLPCAGEGQFAKKTIKSVSDSVPGGSGGEILANIVVVDDGSKPPLTKSHLSQKFLDKYKVTLLRNERTQGLIRAKALGATGATGDIIVFFDCHVAPQDKWYEEFIKASAENYRRIVVPQITDLDIDTWKERNRHLGSSKCYLTWDADFKWFTSTKPEMPVLSGGLLGISRRWWNETGGYDDGMTGWGGENIDQSLRTWLCGGEIVSLPKAFVAHMWRVPHDKRTAQNYAVDVRDTIKNRMRAVMGWYGPFSEKTLEHFPDMRMGRRVKGDKDLSSFKAAQERLGCRPFAWFLWRFRDIYEGAGMLPDRTFRIRYKPRNLCLTYLGPAGTHPRGADTVELQPCDDVKPNRMWPSTPPDAQRWHRANKDRVGGGGCCSGLRVWSTDQCLVASMTTKPGTAATAVCDISGQADAVGVSGGAPGWLPDVAPGQLVVGARCLGMSKDKLVLGKCKPAKEKVKPLWEEIESSVPLETELYRKTLKEHPEYFA